ncbi:hypothetical protein M2277_000858 [Paenibacillus sp. LBL]|uniref:ERF family protein n=1 Tax=Paenibacillus sp. LBL TaxID=2940563 RepID=UPI0024755121|nr:ERF family protein [Paenibacillus sp. LBL]MDH6670214.1 hypothetical protein [Paenibacillus sp. LBL]
MSKEKLYQKISNVMKDVDYLQKDDQVAFGNTKYKVISEEKVTSTVRESLIKNGLVIFPIEQLHSREGTLSTVDVKYKIVDTETGEYEVLVSSGTGADTQDKGVGKAMTYAYKYLLLRTFAIPTGEDPDKISSAELDAKELPNEQNEPQKNNQTKRTAAQVKRLFAIASSKGFSTADVKKVIMKDYNKTQAFDLTKEEYDELCNRLESAGKE